MYPVSAMVRGNPAVMKGAVVEVRTRARLFHECRVTDVVVVFAGEGALKGCECHSVQHGAAGACAALLVPARVTHLLQLLADMMDKCGHAFRLQVAKKILPRLQVRLKQENETHFLFSFGYRYSRGILLR